VSTKASKIEVAGGQEKVSEDLSLFVFHIVIEPRFVPFKQKDMK